jgi:hypothetical protein
LRRKFTFNLRSIKATVFSGEVLLPFIRDIISLHLDYTSAELFRL